jgi:nicotinamidase-related amidase
MGERIKEALLVIDMLNDFVLPQAPLEVPETRRILPKLSLELAVARRRGIPIIYVNDSHKPKDPEFTKMGWPPHAVQGTEGALVVKQVCPRKGDRIVAKHSYSGFYGTSLHRVLKGLGVTSLVLTGCVTNICILYIAYEARLRGYEVRVKKDCVAGLALDSHEFALRQMRDTLGVQIQ